MSMTGNYEGSREWLIEQNEALKARVAELEVRLSSTEIDLSLATFENDMYRDEKWALVNRVAELEARLLQPVVGAVIMKPASQFPKEKGFFAQLREIHADVMADRGEGDE